MVSLRISDSLDVLSKFRRGGILRRRQQHSTSLELYRHYWSNYPSPHPSIRCMLPWLRLFAFLTPGSWGWQRNDSTCPHRIGYIGCHVHSVCHYLAGRWVLRWCERSGTSLCTSKSIPNRTAVGSLLPCPRLWIESHLQTQGASRYAMVALQSTLAPIPSRHGSARSETSFLVYV